MKKTLSEVVKKIEMDLIDPPKKDQRIEIDMEMIVELAESIDIVGLQQPILLVPNNGRFEIVWGHRRYLAHKWLKRETILAKVQELDKTEITILRATENIHRHDITPIEEAYVYHELKEKAGLNYEQIAKRMRKGAGIIRRRLDLLRMPEILQKAIHNKRINYAVAEDLWKLQDINAIEYYLPFCIEHGATSSVVRQWVKDEMDKKRRGGSDVEGGSRDLSPSEVKPVYVACDLCNNPMAIGTEKSIRACPKCAKAIKKALEEQT